MKEDYTEQAYWDDIKGYAKEICEEYPDADDANNERCDRVHETVDGSAWIIYTYAYEKVLQYSDNEPDPKEVSAMSGPDADWRKMQQIAAFMAMEADLWDAIRQEDERRAEVK